MCRLPGPAAEPWTSRAANGCRFHARTTSERVAYDVRADIGRIVDRVAPREREPVIVKACPNAFTGTNLASS